MHGVVAARLGDAEMALRYFRQTAAIDLADTHAAIDGGVHIAGLGGIWMLAVFGFAGLSLQNDGVAVDPHLPAAWRSLTFRVQWRHRCLWIRIYQQEQLLEATLESGEPITLGVRGERYELRRDLALQVFTGGGNPPSFSPA
jgi:trehalose/maltose hydrolase-like predicted phosphorylase